MPKGARPQAQQTPDQTPQGSEDAALAAAARAVCARHGDDPAELLEILHDLQHDLGHVPAAALGPIARALNLGRAEVHGVVTFYPDFRDAPAQPIEIQICRAEACQAMGARALDATLEDASGVTVTPVYCLGNCALAPAARINGRLQARLTPERLAALLKEVRAAAPCEETGA